MKKSEFLDKVRAGLAGLSEEDINKALDFYSEAIDDRIEDGLTEDQAVTAIGTPEEISKQILMDTPLPKLVKAKTSNGRKLKTWEIVLIIATFPIWLPGLLVAGSIAIALLAALFSVIIAFFAVVFALGLAGLVLAVGAFFSIFGGGGFTAVMQIGIGLVALGLAVLLFIPVKAFVLWIIELMGRFVRWIKSKFVNMNGKKEA